MFVICINKLALKIMKKKRNDFVANPIFWHCLQKKQEDMRAFHTPPLARIVLV